MVDNSQLKQDLLVTLLIIAIIGGIAGAILYKQSLDNQGPDNTDNPTPTPPPIDNNTDTNTDTNTTNPDNGNVTDPQDYFEHICNIEPKADVCIKPLVNINGTNSTTTN